MGPRHHPDTRRGPFSIPSSLFPFRDFRVFRGHIRIHLRQGDELIQPPVGYHEVVVQEDQVLYPRDLQALVDRGGKAVILGLITEQPSGVGVATPDQIRDCDSSWTAV